MGYPADVSASIRLIPMAPSVSLKSLADISLGAVGYEALNYTIPEVFKRQLTTTANSAKQPHYNITIYKSDVDVHVVQITTLTRLKGRVKDYQIAIAKRNKMEADLAALDPRASASHTSIEAQITIQNNKLAKLHSSVGEYFEPQHRDWAMAIEGDVWMPGAPTIDPGSTTLKGFIILNSLTRCTTPIHIADVPLLRKKQVKITKEARRHAKLPMPGDDAITTYSSAIASSSQLPASR